MLGVMKAWQGKVASVGRKGHVFTATQLLLGGGAMRVAKGGICGGKGHVFTVHMVMCTQPPNSCWPKGATRVTQVMSALVPRVVLFPKSLLHVSWGVWERMCHGSRCRHNKELQLRSFFGPCVLLHINQINQPHLSSEATNNLCSQPCWVLLAQVLFLVLFLF